MKRRTMLLLAVVLIAAAAWMLSLQDSTPLAGDAPDATTSTAATENAGAPPAAATDVAAAPNTATALEFMNPGVHGMPPIALPHPVDRSLTPAAARALHRRVVDLRDCSRARDPDYHGTGADWERDTGTTWLQATERESVLAGRRAAIERMLGACRRQGLKTSGTEFDDEPQGWVVWAIESAAASGDIGARLDAARFDRRRQPDFNGVVRPLLTAAVANGDPEIVPLIGLVVARSVMMLQGRMPAESVTPTSPRNQNRNTDLRALWTLVACDLGLDCGPTSPTLDRLCLRDGLCGYPSVQAALRDGQIPEAQATATEAERQWLVARIRSGQIDGMFDPAAPVPARPGGG